MRPLVHPQLTNDVFGDPGVYAEVMFERRAFLFDVGDVASLPPRKLLKVSDVFVSHAHADHFFGFDRLLRLFLGRDKTVRVYGPEGIADRVGHKLAGYTWNLLGGYATDLAFEVLELCPSGVLRAARFSSRADFGREDAAAPPLPQGVLLDDPRLRVRAVALDHRVPCLAFALEERAHVNIWRNRLDALGLPVGPWLRDLKAALLRGQGDATPFVVWWREGGERRERSVPLGALKDVAEIVPGLKIGYVVDTLYSDDNARKIVDLVGGADILFIETPFLDADAEIAAHRYHLTARQAGVLARAARVKSLVPFHFSPRYQGRAAELRAEAERAFSG